MNLPSLIFGPFRVAIYSVVYKRGRKEYAVDMVMSPRVVGAASGKGSGKKGQSHGSRQFLLHQIQGGLQQAYGDELAKLHLGSLDYRNIEIKRSRSAGWRQHWDYLVHGSGLLLSKSQ